MDIDDPPHRGRAPSRSGGTAPSRSPSPAPPPPVPTTPGPRAAALTKLYNDAVTHVLRTCNYANFSACFPTPAAQVPAAVRHLHEQFTTKLGEMLRREFDGLLKERNVVAGLNELDRLIEDARRRKAAAANTSQQDGSGATPAASPPPPPHTLPARQLYISHLAPSLTTYAAQLTARQDALAQENAALLARVQQQRSEIRALMAGLEGVVADLQGSVAALGEPEQVAALRAQAREADERMRG